MARKYFALMLTTLMLTPILAPASTYGAGNAEKGKSSNGVSEIDLVDRKATGETRSLFSYLNNVRGEAILFGQQHATTEGSTISVHDGTESEVKNAVGDFPAVYGWDTLSLEGKEKPGVWGASNEANRDALIGVMKKAYERGGVLNLSAHMPNFVTGGSFYDTSGSVVSHIMPGGDKHEEFNKYLDMVADFANHLKDEQGNAIPVVFRPFHENNGSWFWWGAAFTTPAQYKELFRYTVEYLRDKKNVRNFLYAFSPGSPFNNDESKYLLTYPGDDYVDILGFDTYNNGEGTDLWLKQVVEDASLISRIADSKGKVAAFTEFGYSNMKLTGNAEKEWFTKLLKALKSDPDAKRMAYMLTWANFSAEGSFTPFRNHPIYGDHEMLADFTAFYNDEYTAFNKDIDNVYTLKAKTKKQEDGFIHTVSPTDRETIKSAKTTIRVRSINQPVSRMVYSVEGVEGENLLTYNPKEDYYMADWQPSASQNGTSVLLTVKGYIGKRVVYEEPIKVNVEAKDILVKGYQFDSSIADIESLGTYPESIDMKISHFNWNNNGVLKLDVNLPDASQSWQELKLKLANQQLTNVNKLKFDVCLPVNGNENASIQGVALVPPNWNDKYGMGQAKTFSSLEKVTVGQQEFGKYTAEIDLHSARGDLETADELAFSIVTSNVKYSGPIYVDNIQLLNNYIEPVLDPLTVDNFEVYSGNTEKLQSKYTVASQGDKVNLSLDAEHKNSGEFGLKYEYNLGGAGYGGMTKMLGGVDWSGQNTLKFWYLPDGNDQKLVIQVKANDIAFEAYPSLAGNEPQLIEIPFSEFTVAPWDASHAGAVLNETNAKKVQEFSIYVNAKQPGTTLSSVLYFDDIHVTNK